VLQAGKPAVVVVTAVFANLARTAARARGIDPIPMLVLPHPMETRSGAEIDRICDERFEEAIGLIAQPEAVNRDID
jgi:uncharacterized ferredoxin-like protein